MYIKERVLAITRLFIGFLAIINSYLVTQGMNPLPLDEDAILMWVTHGVDALLTVYCLWWKDNNVRKSTIDKKHSV